MKKLAYILYLGILFSCDEDKGPEITCEECTEDLICTREFRTVSFTLDKASGEPIALDRWEAIIVETGEVLHSSESESQLLPGAYIITQDSDLGKVSCEGTDILFEGYLANEKVVDQTFVVAHDCCHVFLMEGPDVIELP